MSEKAHNAAAHRETFLQRFETNWKAAAAVFALLGMGAGVTGWLGLSAVKSTNAAQDVALNKLKEENQIQFQNDVRISEGLKHVHGELKDQRQDYRDVLNGRRLKPLSEHELGIDAETPVPVASPDPNFTPMVIP